MQSSRLDNLGEDFLVKTFYAISLWSSWVTRNFVMILWCYMPFCYGALLLQVIFLWSCFITRHFVGGYFITQTYDQLIVRSGALVIHRSSQFLCHSLIRHKIWVLLDLVLELFIPNARRFRDFFSSCKACVVHAGHSWKHSRIDHIKSFL